MCVIGKASTNHVDEDGALWTWLPRVGGYVSPCRVVSCDIHAGVDACFDVDVYHDGEFPTDHPEITLHFCAHEQLTAFAELVAKHLADVAFVGPPEPPPQTPLYSFTRAGRVLVAGLELANAASFKIVEREREIIKVPSVIPLKPTEHIILKIEVGDGLRDELAELEGDDDAP